MWPFPSTFQAVQLLQVWVMEQLGHTQVMYQRRQPSTPRPTKIPSEGYVYVFTADECEHVFLVDFLPTSQDTDVRRSLF